MSDLTDEELNARLAKACGWTPCQVADWGCEHYSPSERMHIVGIGEGWHRHYECSGWRQPNGTHQHIPALATSVDAILAPGGPAEKAREQGWDWVVEQNTDAITKVALFGGYVGYLRPRGGYRIVASAHNTDSPARALAEAFDKALESTNTSPE